MTEPGHPAVDEDRVRALAHQLWLEEGCPEGQAEDHWQRATVLAQEEAAASAVPVADVPDRDRLTVAGKFMRALAAAFGSSKSGRQG